MASSTCAGGNKLDGQIINVTPRKITLKSGEKLKIAPHVTMTNRFGKKKRFSPNLVRSWKWTTVIMNKVEGEMMIVEIKELGRND